MNNSTELQIHVMDRKKAGFATPSITVPAIAYYSGKRIWYAITVPYGALKSGIIKTSSVKKKGEEIIKSEIKNRFLDKQHKNQIKEYMKIEKQFTIPPVTLVCTERLPFEPIVFGDVTDRLKTNEDLYDALAKVGSLGGIIQIPLDYQFECLDGNHRTVAIRELAEELPEVTIGSNLLLNIVCESDVIKIRQDFVDVNKNARQTTSSINTLFNTRDPLPNLVAKLMEKSFYLENITNVLSTSVSKNSYDIYTLNNIKNAVMELIGIDSQGAKLAEDKANKVLASSSMKSKAEYRIDKFFNILIENKYISECLNNRSNTPNIRNKSIITIGVGLAIVANAANYIFENFCKEEVDKELRRLMEYNWGRNNNIFKKSGIISSSSNEKVITNRASITETKKLVALDLGYKLE